MATAPDGRPVTISGEVIGIPPLVDRRGPCSRRTWMVASLSWWLGVKLGANAFQSPPPIVAVLYRGRPVATANAQDLATLRATGFGALAWPSNFRARQAAARELAEQAGLRFVVVNPASAAAGVAIVDCTARAGFVAADGWRAVQRGAHTVVFDPGAQAGPNLTNATGQMRAWVEPARALSRQLAANPALFGRMMIVPTTALDTGGLDVRVTLHETDRAWLLIATNASARAGRFVTRLPHMVPPALWISLLDGSGMSMRSATEGPQWSAEIGAGEAHVYVIDRP